MKPNDKAIEAAFAAAEAHIGNTSQREWLREILTAAYAAQFKSKDYAGLVERLRSERGCIASPDDCLAAADALEAVLVEREAWKGRQEATAAILKQVETERDALLARLAPVEDEKLVEIVAREIAFAQGDVESPNSEFMDENWHCWEPEARVAIAAIRPHIEAAEREKCQKMLARMGAGTTKTGAVNE